MKIITIGRLPLLSDGETLISKTIAESVGMPVTCQWAAVVSRIKKHLTERLPIQWPMVVVYPCPAESVVDQMPSIMRGYATPAFERVRGFAVFGNLHDIHDKRWQSLDRCVVHACKLGGPFPLTQTVVHEVLHHYLYQAEKLAERYHDQVETEEWIASETHRLIGSIPRESLAGDYGQHFRALDIVSRCHAIQRTADATRHK